MDVAKLFKSPVVTYRETKENIAWKKYPTSEMQICPFCGSVQDFKGFVTNGAVERFWLSPCTCKESKMHRALKDSQEAMEIIAEGMEEYRRESAVAEQERILRNCGINRRYQTRTFDTFVTLDERMKNAKIIAEGYADSFERMRDNEKNGLLLYGDCGCGKTHLACSIVNSLVERGIECKFTTFEEMLLRLRDSYNGGDESELAIRNEYRKAPLLVLDDLAKERATDFSTSVLFDLVNYRYERMLPIVITANHSVEGLKQRLCPQSGDRTKALATASRLIEICYPLNMTGIKDHREVR